MIGKYYIIYLKKNGEIILRTRTTLPLTKIGEESSMGWLVVDIIQNNNKNIVSLGQKKRIA